MTSDTKSPSFLRQCMECIFLLSVVCVVRIFIFGLYQVPTGSMETTMLVGERFAADKLSYFFRAPQQGEIVALIDPTYTLSNNIVMQTFERYAWGPVNWTKRVIACPGDHVRGVIEDGKAVVYVNDKKLDEPYLNTYPLIETLAQTGRCTPRTFDPNKSYTDQPFYKINEEKVIRKNDGTPCLVYPNAYVKSKTNPLARGDRFFDGSDEFSFKLRTDEYWLMGDNRRGSSDSRVFGPIKRQNIFAHMLYCILSVDSNESWLIVDILKNPIAFWNNLRWNRFIKKLL